MPFNAFFINHEYQPPNLIVMKKPVFNLLLMLVVSIVTSDLRGQTRADLTSVNFYPPSALSMMSYIDYPVSPRTGIPDINIPLYTICSGELELPITLSFHMGDYSRANRIPGCVGAGWSLSCELQVSRTINGIDDFHQYGYLTTGIYEPNYPSKRPSLTTGDIAKMWRKTIDGEPDKFYYKTLSGGGSFYILKDGAVPQSVPVSGDKIVYNKTGSNKFVITDTDGAKYYYASDTDAADWCGITANEIRTAWKCKKIVSVSGKDEISFTYGKSKITVDQYDGVTEIYDSLYKPSGLMLPTYVTNALMSPRLEQQRGDATYNYMLGRYIDDEGLYTQYDWVMTGTSASVARSYRNVESNVISRITFRGGYATFLYDTSVSGDRNGSELKSISIYANGNSVPIRTITFSYAVGSSSIYDRVLTGVTIDGKQRYTISTPEFERGPGFADFWGYAIYGGSTGMPAVPYQRVHIADGEGWDTEGSTTFVGDIIVGNQGGGNDATVSQGRNPKVKIAYPTGGSTVFTFEHNAYSGRQYDNAKTTSSYRIKHIGYYDSDNRGLKDVNYKYGRNESGLGTVRHDLYLHSVSSGCHSDQNVDYYTRSGSGYTFSGRMRKRTYLPRFVYETGFSDGNDVNYDYVTEYQSDDGELSGKTVYTYKLYGPTDSHYGDGASLLDFPYAFTHDCWYMGVQDSVIHYKYTPYPSAFTPVEIRKYTYDCNFRTNKILRCRTWATTQALLLSQSGADPDALAETHSQYMYAFDGIDIGCVRLRQELVSRRMDDDRTMDIKTDYYYDNPNCYTPNRKQITYSDGRVTTEQTLYPEDYTSSPLTANNLLSRPLETIVRTDGKVVDGRTYTYDTYGRPTSVYRLEAENLAEASFRLSNKTSAGNYTGAGTCAYSKDSHYVSDTTLQYDSFGNIREVQSKGQPAVCYVWGYNGQYLVAEIRNASYSQVRAALTAAEMESILTSAAPTTAQLQKLDALRTSHPEWLVTTATYKPLVGMLSQTNHSGRKTSYSYNAQNHLIKVADDDGNTVTEYDYSIDK